MTLILYGLQYDIFNQMGAVKSFTHAFTWSEYLFWYIERRDIPHIQEVLEKKPELLNKRISVHYATTPLHRCANNGSLELVKLLVEKYGAEVDAVTDNGETALVAAVKRNHISIVRYLVSAKADPSFRTKSGLTVYEHAILNGLYEMAQHLLENCKQGPQLRSPQQYEELRVRYRYRYVNYRVLIQGLHEKMPVENMPDFLTKEKIYLEDPVVDPRETWGHWIKRIIQFKDPPLVERRDLPAELQPQNRRFGKIRHFFSKNAMSKLSQKPTYLPQNQTEIIVVKNNKNAEIRQEKQSQIEMNSIS